MTSADASPRPSQRLAGMQGAKELNQEPSWRTAEPRGHRQFLPPRVQAGPAAEQERLAYDRRE
ncbi:MAG: hypothetical protein K6T86_03370 [Pirellulales bacterium]|nr:hypothetical protein [Pirellulales bacterium]